MLNIYMKFIKIKGNIKENYKNVEQAPSFYTFAEV